MIRPKQYKDRIGKWGLNKNFQGDEMEAMIRKRHGREKESNKQTSFLIRGHPVNDEKIERYIKGHPKNLATDDGNDMDRNVAPEGMTPFIKTLLEMDYLIRSWKHLQESVTTPHQTMDLSHHKKPLGRK